MRSRANHLAILIGIPLAAFGVPGSAGAASNEHACPMMGSHADGVDARGDQGMGFDHLKTTHHFLLSGDGGVIEVSANDPADAASRDQIRMHLKHVAMMFASGDFSIPMFVHDQVPPGVPAMKRAGSKIAYTYEEIGTGGTVRIRTSDPEAVAAVHEFLRFQIRDHGTGDPQ
jgi:hypothetical protein